MSLLNITVRPDAYRFPSYEIKELRDTLIDINQNTLISPILSPRDLILNEETGQTLNGYNYTDTALSQLTGELSPGLGFIVLDLCGQWRKISEDKRLFSSNLAIEIFNKVVNLRFEKSLVGMQLVKDIKKKVIDGVVGMRYRYLPNLDFMERVFQPFEKTNIKFFEACLYGRHLFIRFKANDVVYTINNDTYHPGFQFANSEDGKASVNVALIITKDDTDYSALGPTKEGTGGRVHHSGKGFERKLHTLLTTTNSLIPKKAVIEDGGNSLLNKSLSLGGSNHEKSVRHIVSVLCRRGLTIGFAKRVITSASAFGSGESDSLTDRMPDEHKDILTRRNVYDLFVALIREAKQLPLDQRGTAEQVAYLILTGKIVV